MQNNRYNFNNWLKEDNTNIALVMIKEKGAAVAMNKEGALLYRLSQDEPFETSKSFKAISKVFTNLIGREVVLIDKPKVDENDIPLSLYVEAQELKMIVDEKLEPHTNEEFMEEANGLYSLNKYKPSHYMQLEPKPNYPYSNEIHAISALIDHLSNNDPQRAQHIINWLAYFRYYVANAQRFPKHF